MIRNHFLVAWRNLLKNKGYTSINIVGLAIGMAVTLLIALWAVHQYSYDHFLPGYQQVYHVKMNFTGQHDGTTSQDATSLPVADVLRKEVPGIKRVAEANSIGNEASGLVVGDKKLYLKGGAAGPAFWQMFPFPFVKGDPATAFRDPFSIVIDQATAKALFGNKDPLNQAVKIDNDKIVKVTGVIKDIPANSSLQFSFLLPFAFEEQTQDWVKQSRTHWTYNSFQIFVQLDTGASYAQIAPKIRNLVYERSPEMRPGKPAIWLQPYKDVHLYSEFKNGKVAGGFIDYVHLFTLIGLLVLVIACVNFMNLSTARSEKRAREVGVRKALGSQRIDLIVQFLTESIVIAGIASILAMLLVQLLLPAFNGMTRESIRMPWYSPAFWCCMLGYVLLTGLFAGSRPAFYLSSFSPVMVLKGAVTSGRAATLSRKVLVVMQFSCSVALIISTIIVYRQLQYAKDRPTGYDANRLMMTDMSADLVNNFVPMRQEMIQSGVVEDAAMSTSIVTEMQSHCSLDNWPGKTAADESVNIGSVWVSDSYFKALGMKIVAGRDFSADIHADSAGVILNEAAVRRIGLKEPIGRMVTWNCFGGPVRVLGVVKDALMESPFKPVAPAIFYHGNWGNSLLYRLSAHVKTQDALPVLAKLFEKYNPAYPWSYQFVDEVYSHKFNLEVLVGKLAGIFAGLAILISCLGLFGLAAFVAEQRTREIGIRKVLGASVSQLWVLLSKDFLLLVLLSCLVASPVAFYFLHGWLQQYDYRISIGAGVFVLAAVMAVLITVLTVSFQAIKAALANPANSIRTE
ncbi:MAG TPA: ABC transporter permease [Puia sp.]|jgi:ABC-type antimicrobial peptide transport system permease subunit|nr:ABC transporter permease [Puia sp.]